MTNSDGYEIRPVTDDDLESLERLYEHCFGEPDYGTLRNKFATGVFGQKNIGYLAVFGGEIVASYVVYPVFLQVGGRRLLGAQSGDTMTHTDHRRKGLFLKLAKLTYELAVARNIELIFGFPNESSLPGFQTHLAWSFLPNMVGATFRGRRAIWPKSEKSIRNALRSIEASDIPEQDQDGVVVDAAYLEYKAKISNCLVIEFEGLHAWLVPGKRLDVGGFVYNGDNLEATLKELLLYSGAQSMRFSFTPGHRNLALLAPICELQEGTPAGYLALADHDYEQLKFSRGDFDYF